MSLITITVDMPDFEATLEAVERMSRGNLPYTREAVRAAVYDVVQRTWIQYASGVTVTYSGGTFRINVVTGEYIRSIQEGVRFLDDLTGEVFTTSPHGRLIEEGQPARDLKPALLGSPKAKTGKKGQKYITVPFRHGTPGTVGLNPMPEHIYAQASQLGYSRKNGLLKQTAKKVASVFKGKAAKKKTYKYTWGGRLGQSDEGRRSHIGDHPGAGYTWKTGLYSGMVRMGKPKHTEYLTFRRVSERSDPRSWQHPGVEPRPIREAVVENTREEVLQLIRRGFEMDLYFAGLGGDG